MTHHFTELPVCLPVKGKERTTPLRIQWEYTQEDRSSCKRAGPALGTGYASCITNASWLHMGVALLPLTGITATYDERNYSRIWSKTSKNLFKAPGLWRRNHCWLLLPYNPCFQRLSCFLGTHTHCREDKTCLLTDQYLAQHHALKRRSLTR